MYLLDYPRFRVSTVVFPNFSEILVETVRREFTDKRRGGEEGAINEIYSPASGEKILLFS